jgi:pimeloyl-ACP methyl ester carboxylesterase
MTHPRVIPGRVLACMFIGGVLIACGGTARAASSPTASAASAHLKVGSLELERCAHGAYCGHIDRPLDPTGAIPTSISIHFEYYPHTAKGPSKGTLVATEGGPGYAATESRADYLALWQPLRDSRDFVLMDNRGTGQSGALDCPELQAAERWTVELIGACGRSLGDRAALYGTAYAADDLAEILRLLGRQRIDLYGDSYGTYFEQVFALRHPDLLRSIVLDGAYPLGGRDYAWYPSYAPAMRDKFNLTCRRFTPCAAIPGDSIEHIRPALERLRKEPFPARAADDDGEERAFTADASMLATVMFAAAPALLTTRETDAAARAFAEGDRAPLLRLMAETASGVDSRDPTASPAIWSAGLSAAVMCHDPPQIFDMRLPLGARRADRDRALDERRRSASSSYAPFTIDEFRGMPLDYSFLDQCVEWPVAPAANPASTVTPLDVPYPSVPALIISGELDDLTTPADGAAVAAAFPHGTQVVMANSFHVNALPRARSRCGATLVRRFVTTLEVGDTGCAARVPPLALVARFALRMDEVEPARPLPGNAAGESLLRAAAAAVMTVGDVAIRAPGNSGGHGVGLRGGTYEIASDASGTRIRLHEVRFAQDLAVSGSVLKPTDPARLLTARLELSTPAGLSGHIEARWRGEVPDARVTLRGIIEGKPLAATVPAF